MANDLADDLAGLSYDPLGFTHYAFPWGKEGCDLDKSAGPRPFQTEVLSYVGEHLSNPATRFQPCRIAISSGHGIGKSALVAFLINWGMSTCPDCKIVTTANTRTQLVTKTVPEVRKWTRLAVNNYWWEASATAIKARDPEHSETWRTDFIPWNVENTEAFQGLHNLRKRILLVFDEASAIDDPIWETAEGALTDEDTEIIWVAFGNPTRNTGRFRECFGKFKHRWKTFQIDSRTVEGTNKQEIQQWADDWGEDSDFFRVRVRGEFPRAGSDQFISPDSVARSRKFKAVGFEQFPKVLGVDVARFGEDQTVLMLRQGRKARCLGRYRGKDTAQVTALVIAAIEEHGVDATVVDSDGIGNTVYDQLKFQGFGKRLFEFHGGKPANNAAKYFNQRAEIWGAMRDALEAGMEIPDEPELEDQLIGPKYGFSSQNQIQLEKKDDMKKRGLDSPDLGDALAMTFAVQVMAKPKPGAGKMVYPGQMNQSWMS